MKKIFTNPILTIGIAIFSMFFGAGNIIFPLLLGIASKSQLGWAFFGLMLTAIGGPLIGLTSATLFHGKCKPFFLRAGKIPGGILLTLSIALLGPLAVLPRCVTVAYSAMELVVPAFPIWIFSILFCFIALICCLRKNLLLPILSYILSPLLIASLCLIIFFGITSPLSLDVSTLSSSGAFLKGILTGYDTMDLIASIFFSAGIWHMIAHLHPENSKQTIITTLKAGAVGCLLLALIYLGLSYTAALHSDTLASVPPQKLMYALALLVLGPKLGMVASIAIALACLTTLISLTMTLSNIVTQELAPKKTDYEGITFLIFLITMLMSLINFNTILSMIHHTMTYCYPVIIALTIYNLFKRPKFLNQEIEIDSIALVTTEE